jgi:hypothetical protein
MTERPRVESERLTSQSGLNPGYNTTTTGA